MVNTGNVYFDMINGAIADGFGASITYPDGAIALSLRLPGDIAVIARR